MITVLTAFTEEVDDAQLALEEILAQLDLEHTLKKNSAAIVMFHAEFVETGVVQYISKKLPFDTVGCTTVYSATSQGAEAMVLTVSVLTSDEACFSTATSMPIRPDAGEAFGAFYAETISARGDDRPQMIVQFYPQLPILLEQAFDVMHNISPHIPLFGTVAVDNGADFSDSCCVHNGQVKKDCLSMLLLWGEVKASFFVATLPEAKTQKFKAKITKSEGNLLMEADNLLLVDYFESIGLPKEYVNNGSLAIPFMIDFNDGTPPVARGINFINDEGYAVGPGVMPQGGTIAISTLDDDVVLSSTEQTFTEILQKTKPRGLLAFSCITRYYTLIGQQQDREISIIRDKLDGRVPFQVAYSGGEICPMPNTEGKLINKYHNFSLVVCAFE